MKKTILSLLFLLPFLAGADTLVPTQPALDAKADADGGNITDPAVFRDAVGVAAPQSASLPYTSAALIAQKSINTTPLRVTQLAFGDSYGVSLAPQLDRQVAVLKGGGMGNAYSYTEGAWKTNQFTRAINGYLWELSGSGHYVSWPSSGTFTGFKIHVFYTKESGAGTFSVACDSDGAGYVDVPGATAGAPISADNGGAVDAGVFTYEFGTSLPRVVKVTRQSGTVRILGIVVTDVWENKGSIRKGGTEFFDLSASGSIAAQAAACPQAVYNTVLQTLKPHFATFKADDDETQLLSLQTIIDKCKTAWPTMDWVLVSKHPAAAWPSNELNDDDKVLREIAETNRAVFFDVRRIMPSYADMQTLGYITDTVHLTEAGKTYQNEAIMTALRGSLKSASSLAGTYNENVEVVPRYPVGPIGIVIPSKTNSEILSFVDWYGSGANPLTRYSISRYTDDSIQHNYGTNQYGRLNVASDGRHFIAGGTDGFGYASPPTKPGRAASGLLEVHTGNQAANVGIVVSGRSGQTGNLLEFRSGANVGSGTAGTLDGRVTADARGELKTIKTSTYTVATLPTSTAGTECYVSDSNAAHAGNSGNVVAGGGSSFVPVYYDGTNWRIR